MKMTARTSKVVQVSNIAPQVTKDQMHVLFSFLGKIEEIRLYPTIRNASCPVHSRICYIKFVDASTVPVSQHMTDAVFIDRALIVIPMSSEEIPDECYVLEMTNHGAIVPGLPIKDPKLPPHVVNSVFGSGENQKIHTTDTTLHSNNLPPYPPLPAYFDSAKVEESRRTILMLNYNPTVTTDEVIDFFRSAGEVKYLRTCKRKSDESINLLVEFTDQPSVVNALKMNGMDLKGSAVEIQHATQPITKPQTKSDDAAQQEIEEAASGFREEQYMMGASKEPDAAIQTKDERRSRSRSSGRRKRSRSRSRSRRRSTSRSHRSSSRRRDRSRSRSGSRRLRSRRRRSTSRKSRHRSSRRRSTSRKGSRSGNHKERSTSTSRDGSRSRRSSSRSSKLCKERSSTVHSRDKGRDRSRDRKSRKQDPSKEQGNDKYSSSSKGKGDTTESSGDMTSEKIVSRPRSSSRSREPKKRERKRSKSRDSRRRSSSPRLSRKRVHRSRSRGRDQKGEKRDRS